MAAELPGRKFGGTVCVGADSIRPPPLQIFEQNHIGPEMKQYCKYAIFRHDTAELDCKIFDIALSAHSADVVSPRGNNRAADSRPYADGATDLPPQKFLCGVVANQPPATVANF